MILKTYQNRINLQKFVIEGCNNFRPSLIQKDLQNIIIESSLIFQKVYDDSLFLNLFNDIDKIYQKSPHQLAEYFPINSKFYKKLNKINDSYHHLYFYKCDFDNTNFYQILKELSAEKINEKLLKQKAEQINKKLTNNVEGAFIYFKQNNYFGIMFLNRMKHIKIGTLKHQFLHYFEWAKGNNSNDYSGDSNFYQNEIKLIQTYLNPDFSWKNFEYVTNDKEFETLLNDFLNILVEIKQKYFYNMTGYQAAKMFCNDLIFRRSVLDSEIIGFKEYFLSLRKLKYFNQIQRKTSFYLIVVYVLLQYRMQTIKHHVFGKFSQFQKIYQEIKKKEMEK